MKVSGTVDELLSHVVINLKYVDLGAATSVFWTHFALYLLKTKNDCFTIYINFKMS